MKYKFYNKLLAFITSNTILFTLCGCSNSKSHSGKNGSSISLSDDMTVDNSISKPVVVTTSVSTVPITTSKITTITSTATTTFVTTSVVSSVEPETASMTSDVAFEYTEYDNSILGHFEQIGNGIKNSVDTDALLENGKKYFVYCVDFLFYDGEINGIKFCDLTDMAKQQLLRDITTIDSLICSKFPNYKESIGEYTGAAYNKAFEVIKAGSSNIRDFSKDKLGEDNYDKISEVKDMFIQQTIDDFNQFTDILDQGKQYLKDLYEGLK